MLSIVVGNRKSKGQKVKKSKSQKSGIQGFLQLQIRRGSVRSLHKPVDPTIFYVLCSNQICMVYVVDFDIYLLLCQSSFVEKTQSLMNISNAIKFFAYLLSRNIVFKMNAISIGLVCG